jgi:D-alanine-D-alanine ligase-like ATP-grasp enzyme
MENTELPFAQTFAKLAENLGATVLLDSTKTAGQITFQSGRRRYFLLSSLDLNHVAASDIVRNKQLSNSFMDSMGYKVIDGAGFPSPQMARHALRNKTIGWKQILDKAKTFAQSLGYPVVVKPNNGSKGHCVEVVHDDQQLHAALKNVFSFYSASLVQRVIKGLEYRIDVLDGEVVWAFQRTPLHVIGDGVKTIRTLLKEKQTELLSSGRGRPFDPNDPRIKRRLRQNGMSGTSIPLSGQCFYLLDNANVCAGAEIEDVKDCLHPSLSSLATSLASDLNLRYCGIDLILDHHCDESLTKYAIIEVNPAPAVDVYGFISEQHRSSTHRLCQRLLEKMDSTY